jgi:hypothetical protein
MRSSHARGAGNLRVLIAHGSVWFGWLLDGFPQNVGFTAGGTEYALVWDGNTFLTAGTIPNGGELLNWSAIATVLGCYSPRC